MSVYNIGHGQSLIRLEAEAVRLIPERCENRDWLQVSSEMARIKISTTRETDRRTRILLLPPEEGGILFRKRATKIVKYWRKP
jgi:hypothetical protein